MPESDDLVRAHIATDHAIRQPGLKWLIDDATFVREIRFAPVHEIAERHILGHAAAGRMQHPNGCRAPRWFGCEFDLPHSLAAVASVLFEDARAGCSQTLRKFFAERCSVAVQMGVRAPAKKPGAVKDFLRTGGTKQGRSERRFRFSEGKPLGENLTHAEGGLKGGFGRDIGR
jgi:hypothetical protein